MNSNESKIYGNEELVDILDSELVPLVQTTYKKLLTTLDRSLPLEKANSFLRRVCKRIASLNEKYEKLFEAKNYSDALHTMHEMQTTAEGGLRVAQEVLSRN